MAIEPITREEFERVHTSHRSECFIALSALQPMTGIKMPCRWKHNKNGCTGPGAVYACVKSAGFKIQTSCRDGVFYTFRYE